MIFDDNERIVTGDFIGEDADIEVGLRPRQIGDYIGQEKVKEKADYIAKSNDENGIVQVIDEFILWQ